MIDWFLKILYKTESQNAEAKQIAKHLSKILLHELSGVEALYPDVKEKCETLIKKMQELKAPITITETFRSAKKQDRLSNGLTKAKGLQSYHQYGLAFDIIFEEWGYQPPAGSNWWNIVGKEGEKLGLEWGGSWTSFPDTCHFQWTSNGKITWSILKNYFEK